MMTALPIFAVTKPEGTPMIAELELQEYLDEMRQHVCTRCVERPAGGPPCAPLGKNCGVEMHLPRLVDSVRAVHSDLVEPYLERNRREICSRCAFLHSDICPCPMDYLSVLVVEAIETVDRRRRERNEARQAEPDGPAAVGAEEVHAAYMRATGTWSGCDWATMFGETGLDLNDWDSADAERMAAEADGEQARADWGAAVGWLKEIERAAREAEAHAAAAVAAAGADDWRLAREHAERAWALEFGTGRPLWHSYPFTWQDLHRVVETACASRLPAHEVLPRPTLFCGRAGSGE
jgi:hypothetical protein